MDLVAEGLLPGTIRVGGESELWEEAVVWELTGGDGERRRGCKAAAAVLLGHPGLVAGRGSAYFAGNEWRPRRAACSGELDGVIKSREKVIWEEEGGGVDLFRKEGWPFISGRGSTKDGLGRPGHRMCRLWEGQGVALAQRGHVRQCYGYVGGAMAQPGDEGERGAVARGGGVRVCSSSSPPCLTARVRAEGAGLDQGDSPSMATGFERR
jgi:hypothetical protein